MKEADAARRAKAEKIVQRSAEEQRERARLLGEYGYDSDPLDEEGNPILPEDGEGGEGTAVSAREGEGVTGGCCVQYFDRDAQENNDRLFPATQGNAVSFRKVFIMSA